MQPDGLTFELADTVHRTPVRYKNRYGIELAADLYTAHDLDESTTHPGLVIGPPHGGVKEQGPGVYANQLAQRGFVALAFDPSFNGESGGEPRHVTSPEIFSEDFSAGVDYLGTLAFVDRARIGALGICGSGGFALNQAGVDPRIKAVATTALVDISGANRQGRVPMTDRQRKDTLAEMAEQRWKDVDSGTEPALEWTFPQEYHPEGLDAMTAEFHEYYVLDRGHHPRSIGGFTITSYPSHIAFGPLQHVADISPRPVLMITGDRARTRSITEEAYAQAQDPKELVVVPGARHIDLYDNTALIPFDTLETFFTKNLAG